MLREMADKHGWVSDDELLRKADELEAGNGL